MVRKVIYGALAVFLLFPAAAFAVPDGSSPDSSDTTTVYQTYSPDYSSRLDTLDFHLQNIDTSVTNTKTETIQHLIAIEGLLKPVEDPKVSQELTEEESEETKQLKELNGKIDGITKLLEVEEVPAEKDAAPVSGTKGTKAFSAWANVNPTGTYAQYAMGYLPRVDYKDHYAFLQDSQNSYVFVWGDLNISGSTISGKSDWVRWYYTNSNGYLVESGQGDTVTINTNSHVVMSDLDGMPMLGVENELLRKELGFYALVAVAVFSLASVLGFCIRLSSRYS